MGYAGPVAALVVATRRGRRVAASGLRSIAAFGACEFCPTTSCRSTAPNDRALKCFMRTAEWTPEVVAVDVQGGCRSRRMAQAVLGPYEQTKRSAPLEDVGFVIRASPKCPQQEGVDAARIEPGNFCQQVTAQSLIDNSRDRCLVAARLRGSSEVRMITGTGVATATLIARPRCSANVPAAVQARTEATLRSVNPPKAPSTDGGAPEAGRSFWPLPTSAPLGSTKNVGLLHALGSVQRNWVARAGRADRCLPCATARVDQGHR